MKWQAFLKASGVSDDNSTGKAGGKAAGVFCKRQTISDTALNFQSGKVFSKRQSFFKVAEFFSKRQSFLTKKLPSGSRNKYGSFKPFRRRGGRILLTMLAHGVPNLIRSLRPTASEDYYCSGAAAVYSTCNLDSQGPSSSFPPSPAISASVPISPSLLFTP